MTVSHGAVEGHAGCEAHARSMHGEGVAVNG